MKKKNIEPWRKKLLDSVNPELRKLDLAHQVEHSLRVYANCEAIAASYKKADLDLLYAAAMVHDLGQTVRSFNEHSDISIGLARQHLIKAGFPLEKITAVNTIIAEHDNYIWVEGHEHSRPKSLESRIFQDADRLESLGVMGIIRQFVFAGKHGKTIYDQTVKPHPELVYGGNISAIHTIRDHQLKIYKHLNTKKAKEISKENYEFIKLFLKQFFKEWH